MYYTGLSHVAYQNKGRVSSVAIHMFPTQMCKTVYFNPADTKPSQSTESDATTSIAVVPAYLWHHRYLPSLYLS